uniref:Uncharacterized protein n=1 Tax=Favella ehrenbergii TaxID=182087 RepID=A0A7S3HXV3_9SPIT|mmetsp:Transcript_17281/g.21814  ORF Transcript_17281/g.21814 Transcript_17281/m.21814 type:complete len:142 (+) Transcript_17281:112-537(+)|eukprot:CAMPEP_0170467714 /NCGR_PEP_ID=MMETSP0123-20130129/11197_1 /TAXON_ID=182087 /ORGANISM="Favella ehrenbergii, Strain Fehren 1" /LENGTH=141 /DNA_ID=CAMNT_0010734165 /DNA_START=107 /DNA_END=532 /DNA_ORIENTATION=-
MNEVDEDNNIVGELPFFGQTLVDSKNKGTVAVVRSVLMVVLIIAVLALTVFVLYRVYKWFRSTGSSKGKSAKKASSSSSGGGNKKGFSVFKDDEENKSELKPSSSVKQMLGFEKPPEPKKKGFWAKTKAAFSFGKKKDGKK